MKDRMVSYEDAMDFATAVAITSGWQEAPSERSLQPWEQVESLCGYSLFTPLDPDYCHHEGCWWDRKAIASALDVMADYEHGDCAACDDEAGGAPVREPERPLRLPDTYAVGPVTEDSRRIEDSCMASILEAFTDEEIRYIRDSLERSGWYFPVGQQRGDSGMGTFLWSMFDSISTSGNDSQ